MTNFVKDGDNGIGITHNWAGDGYAKVYSARAGLSIEQHKHNATHHGANQASHDWCP